MLRVAGVGRREGSKEGARSLDLTLRRVPLQKQVRLLEQFRLMYTVGYSLSLVSLLLALVLLLAFRYCRAGGHGGVHAPDPDVSGSWGSADGHALRSLGICTQVAGQGTDPLGFICTVCLVKKQVSFSKEGPDPGFGPHGVPIPSLTLSLLEESLLFDAPFALGLLRVDGAHGAGPAELPGIKPE